MAERHSDGSRGLRAFLEKHAISQRSAAEALGVTDPAVHDWVTGAKRPRAHHRVSIEVWTRGSVVAASWAFPEERAAARDVVPFDPDTDAA